MPSRPNLHLSFIGFSDSEQDRLFRQLKAIDGQTAFCCLQARPEKAAATLVLTKPESGDLIDARFRSPTARSNLVMSVDAPLRLHSLLELLQVCESRIIEPLPESSLVNRLATLKAPALVLLGVEKVLVLPGKGQVLSRFDYFDDLHGKLASCPDVTITEASEDQALAVKGLYKHSLRRLLWSLAFNEHPAGVRNWLEDDVRYKIDASSLFENWECSPAIQRLVMLFSRQYASLDLAANFSSLSEQTVIAFLHACESAGLVLSVRKGLVGSEMPSPAPEAQGLIQRLRNRFGRHLVTD